MNDEVVGSHAPINAGTQPGLIAYFAQNRIAANVLMLTLLAGGLVVASNLPIQAFPDLNHRTVVVTVPSPGSSPREVEEDINRRIEESVIGIRGVTRVVGTATENLGKVSLEVDPFTDVDRVVNDVQSAVDRIENFPPATAEQPDVSLVQTSSEAIRLAVSSHLLTAEQLRQVSERLQDRLLLLPTVANVTLVGQRDREISIELSEEKLRQNNLTLAEVAREVQAASLNVTMGEMRTEAGGIVLQTVAKRRIGDEFKDIPLITRLDGTILRLGDVAQINDGFEDQDLVTEFDGKPAIWVAVDAVVGTSKLDVSKAVRAALSGYEVPNGVDLDVFSDNVSSIEDLLQTVLRNILASIVLVLACLVLVFDLRVAFWIAAGIPISFLGGLLFFGMADKSINSITIFAMFMLVGIVVDDAVVVGENIAAERDKGKPPLEAAIAGARGVVGPITVGVLTTIIAFIPFLFLTTGRLQWLQVLPYVVVFVLLVSLIEAFFILPAHLAHKSTWSVSPLSNIQARVRQGLENVRERVVAPMVSWAVRHTVLTLTIGIVAVLASLLLVGSGAVRVIMFDVGNTSDSITADIELPIGTPIDATRSVVDRLVSAGYELNEQVEGTSIKHISITVGDLTEDQTAPGMSLSKYASNTHKGSVTLHLNQRPLRRVAPDEVERAWRNLIGSVSKPEKLVIRQFVAQPNVAYALLHSDADALQAAANELKSYLHDIGGLFEITNSLLLGKRHFEINVNDVGAAAGVTAGVVAAQLRANYVGLEVQRIQRGREEISVMVRFARDQRHSLSELNDLRIRLPRGGEIPLASVATLTEDRDFETLTRIDGKQAALVSAFADTRTITPMRARSLVNANVIPMLKDRFPGLEIQSDLGARSERVLLETLAILVPIVFLIMYALMAAFLRSYWKPLVAVVGIPVALSGALFLHFVLGWNFSAVSLFGVIGVSGIIVNDALVLLHRYNTLRQEQAHLPAIAVVAAASHHRFRAVLLTTLTTILGLSPMLYERSDELLFLIPLVVSMFGGLIFATVFVLLFLPALVMLVEGRRE